VYTAFLDQTESDQTRAVNAAHPPGKAEVPKGTVVITAHDFNGKQVWQVRPGLFSSKHGFCSAPVLYKDKVIVNPLRIRESYLQELEFNLVLYYTGTSRLSSTRSSISRVKDR